MKSRKGNVFLVLAGVLAILAFAVGGYLYISGAQEKPPKEISWEECIKLPGAKVQYSYPGQCVTSDGQKAIQPLSDEEKKKLEPPSETSSWKTYVNASLQFQFNYPASWKIRETDLTEFYDSSIRIKVAVHKNTNSKILDEIWEVKNCDGEEPFIFCDPQPFTDIKTLTRNGVSIYWRLDGSSFAHAFIPTKNELSAVEIYTLSPKDNPLLDQILSTFKFLDPGDEKNDQQNLPAPYPKVKWLEPKAVDYPFRTKDNFVELKSVEVESETLSNISVWNEIIDYYHAQFIKLGWKEDSWATADGPNGSLRQYSKNGNFAEVRFNFIATSAPQPTSLKAFVVYSK